MTEPEAIAYVLSGGHPGNCIDGAPLLFRTGFNQSVEQEFLKACPREWAQFAWLVQLWFSKRREEWIASRPSESTQPKVVCSKCGQQTDIAVQTAGSTIIINM